MERLAIVDDPSFDLHRSSAPHPECPERLQAARRGLEAAVPIAQRLRLPARAATSAELSAIHPEGHVAQLREVLATGAGELDADTYFNAHTEEAAWRAAGGCIDLALALVRGDARRGLALVRPPGHHAEPTRAMGFCWLNNIALAAHAALDAGLSRVAIVDWDVHHGNGTQAAFEADPRVLFVSLHQWPLYPGTGAPSEIGRGPGQGYTSNVALPARSGAAAYALAFQRVVLPLLGAFGAELILVSAGFDAHRSDPLASMALEAEDYAAMASALVEVAETQGHGRVGLVLEGGYDLAALETSIAAVCRALLGAHVPFETGEADPQAQHAVARSVAALAPHWPNLAASRTMR